MLKNKVISAVIGGIIGTSLAIAGINEQSKMETPKYQVQGAYEYSYSLGTSSTVNNKETVQSPLNKGNEDFTEVYENLWKYYNIPFDDEFQNYIQATCGNYGIDYALVLAIIATESSYRFIEGDNGNSIGYMQVQPKWWSTYITDYNINPYEKEGNITLGVMILSDFINENNGNIKKALKQYNSGNPNYEDDTYYYTVMGYYYEIIEKLEREVGFTYDYN